MKAEAHAQAPELLLSSKVSLFSFPFESGITSQVKKAAVSQYGREDYNVLPQLRS